MLRAVLLLTILFPLQAKEMSLVELHREIRSGRKVTMPQIDFGHGLFYNVSNVCLSGATENYIEPIKEKWVKKGPVKIYLKKKVEGHKFGCVVWLLEDTKKVCRQWGKKPYTHKTEFEVIIDGENGRRQSVRYQLPQCLEVE